MASTRQLWRAACARPEALSPTGMAPSGASPGETSAASGIASSGTVPPFWSSDRLASMGVMAPVQSRRAQSPHTACGGGLRAASAAGGGQKVLGVAFALDLNLGRRALDLGEVIGGQLDVGRAQGLLQAGGLRGPRGWDDPRLLREEPRESDLRRGGVLLACNAHQQIHQGLVLLHRLWRKARQNGPEVAFAELGVLVHRAGQEALAERTVGHKANAEFLAGIQD